MNNLSHRITWSRSQGVTLVEILLVISLLMIILSFAIPTMGGATARAELAAAVENVEYSLDSARNAARMNETAITVGVVQRTGDPAQVMELKRGNGSSAGIPEYRLPEDIEWVADRPRFEFDERGLVLDPGSITLVSRTDDDVRATIAVN